MKSITIFFLKDYFSVSNSKCITIQSILKQILNIFMKAINIKVIEFEKLSCDEEDGKERERI